MLTTLLIDDLRSFRDECTPKEGLVIARNSADALAYLETHPDEHYSAIWFDHDLGEVDGKDDSTMPALDYLAFRAFTGDPVNVDTVYVHTSNPVGRKQILASLERYGYRGIKVQAEHYFIV